jgi:hypothetical protein
MERGSTKHGPLHDEQLARETESMVRESPQPASTEEWREPEPVDDPRELFEGDEALTEQDEIQLRSELARLLTRDEFPAGREKLLGILDEKGAAEALMARVQRLPAGEQYGSTHAVLEALGLSHPEEQPGA